MTVTVKSLGDCSRSHVADSLAYALAECWICGGLGEVIDEHGDIIECHECNGFGDVRVGPFNSVHNMPDDVIEMVNNYTINGGLVLDHSYGIAIFTAPPNASMLSDEQWIELFSNNSLLAVKLREHGWLVKL